VAHFIIFENKDTFKTDAIQLQKITFKMAIIENYNWIKLFKVCSLLFFGIRINH